MAAIKRKKGKQPVSRLHGSYIVDKTGMITAVILDYGEYQKLLTLIRTRAPFSKMPAWLKNDLAFHRIILRGLKDSDEGRTISHEEVERRIESWSKKK